MFLILCVVLYRDKAHKPTVAANVINQNSTQSPSPSLEKVVVPMTTPLEGEAREAEST